MAQFLIDLVEQGSLIFLPEHGVGYYPVADDFSPYDESYFTKYQEYAETPMGRELTSRRVAFVDCHAIGLPVVDVGIGCGSFIEARGGETYGTDINPTALDWLEDRGLRLDLNAPVECATFWDSLEHFADPSEPLAMVERFVFVSLPIFRDAYHVLESRHYRKDEHFWYWTQDGFIKWMAGQGFELIEHSDFEMRLGREDIETFAFERVRR